MSSGVLIRPERILRYLATTPSAQLRAIAVASEGEERAGDKLNQVSASLRSLVASKAVVRTGKPHHYAYRLSAAMAAKLRAAGSTPVPNKPAAQPAAPRALAASPGHATPLPRKPTPEQQLQIAERKPEPNIAPAFGRALRGLTSDDIAADVATFLRKGGHIQQLAPHEGKPFERLFRDDPKPPRPPRRTPATRGPVVDLDDAA